MAIRYVIGTALGAVVTLSLFMIMQALIKSDKSPFDEGVKGRIVDFVRLQEDESIETKTRKPKPPPPPDEPPPDMPKPEFDNALESQGVDISAASLDLNLNIGGIGGFSSDGEYLPIVKVLSLIHI